MRWVVLVLGQIWKSSGCPFCPYAPKSTTYLSHHVPFKSVILGALNPQLKCFSSRLALVAVHDIKARCQVENEDVLEAAPTDDAPTTSEWSTILLPINVRRMLKIWWFILNRSRVIPLPCAFKLNQKLLLLMHCIIYSLCVLLQYGNPRQFSVIMAL